MTNALIEELQAGPWPFRAGPNGINPWWCDAAKFLALIQAHPMLWLRNSRLKYLEVRVDTRSGHFVLLDRDRTPINPDEVVALIKARSL